MKTTPEPLSITDQTEIVKTLGSDGVGHMTRVVSGLMESELARASMSLLAADAFPQQAEEAQKSIQRARRYRNFLEVCEELRGIAMAPDEEFYSVKITSSEVKEVTAIMESGQ